MTLRRLNLFLHLPPDGDVVFSVVDTEAAGTWIHFNNEDMEHTQLKIML